MSEGSRKIPGLDITFATRHGKGVAVADLFLETLCSKVHELSIDSDSIGTFSGETLRLGSMLDAARAKVGLARALGVHGLILVSEGSFSPRPGLPNIPVNTELLLLSDTERGVDVIEEFHTLDTNFDSVVVGSLEEAGRFLDFARFGTHAVVVYPDPEGPAVAIEKGLRDRVALEAAITRLTRLSSAQTVRLMTDMRAHFNPTRMLAIRECAKLLISRLRTPCSACGSSGFGLVQTEPGLPCADCGAPTHAVLREIRACPYCKHRAATTRVDGKTVADPGQCSECNP